MNTLLTLGHGYSAAALARRLIREGWRVIGTTRHEARLPDLAAEGVEGAVWPGQPLAPLLARATHVLVSAAPDAGGDPILRAERPALTAARPVWAGYLSTTSVYGDHRGGWVDETTPPAPAGPRGRERVAAEAEWLALGWPMHVFRLAGIYGPGRGPFAKVREGTARRIVKPGQVFGRIHVEDIAQVLAASIARPRPGAIYNVTDNEPAPPEDVIAHAARLLGLPLPPEESWDTAPMTPMARSFYSESKRVRNDLIREELGVRLRYPDYRAGLAALLAGERG